MENVFAVALKIFANIIHRNLMSVFKTLSVNLICLALSDENIHPSNNFVFRHVSSLIYCANVILLLR